MVVKEKRGRRRYIAFEAVPASARSDLSSLGSRNGFRLIQMSCGWAVLRCGNKDVERVIETMAAAFPESRSRCVSGTLMALRRRYPPLDPEGRHRQKPETIEHK